MLILTLKEEIKVLLYMGERIYSLSLSYNGDEKVQFKIFEKSGDYFFFKEKFILNKKDAEPYCFKGCVKFFYISSKTKTVVMGFEAPPDVHIIRSNCKKKLHV